MVIFRKQLNYFILLLTAIVFICTLGITSFASAFESQAEADYIPWSGWWWPKAKGELVFGYNGRPSPAEKYDLYDTGSRPGVAFREGIKSEWYDPEALAWEGKCNGWVNASILENGPIQGACANGVYLGIGDKKGLLTACHFRDEIVSEVCDPSPEPFHRYLLNYIGEQGEIIGADLDSGPEFWSYPIYAYDMKITPGDKSDYVTCTIKYSSDFVDPNYQGNLEQSATYRYRLDKDAEGNYNGQGEWLKGPAGDMHPQFVWVPVGIRQDRLFVDYKKVREMARTIDDELEGRPDLVPGHHLLMIYPNDDDTFTISPRVGEKITCNLALDSQNPSQNGARFLVENNDKIVESGVLNSELHTINLSSEVGNDNFKLQILPAEENKAGVCVHLYVDVQAQYQSCFYGFPSDQFWIGCAATSLSNNAGDRVWLEIDGNQGLPLGVGQTSGSNLNQGGRWLTVLDNNLTDDYFNNDGKPIGFRLISSTPYQGLLLAGDSHTLRGPPQSNEVCGRKLIIPWLTNAYGMAKFATLYLANQRENSTNVQISYYNNVGEPQATADVELAPEATAEYRRGSYPGIGGIDGWGVIESSADETFSGCVTLKEGYDRYDQLPLLKPAQHWVAPHLVTGLGWRTVLGVCNINQEILILEITAFVDGLPVGEKVSLAVGPNYKRELIIEGALFGISSELMDRAWLRIDGDREAAAYLRYHYQEAAEASIPLYEVSANRNLHKLSQLAVSGGWWTGIVLLNNSLTAVNLELVALNDKGRELQRLPLHITAESKFSTSVAAAFNQVKTADLAQLRLEGEGAPAIKALAFYGGIDGVSLLAVHSW